MKRKIVHSTVKLILLVSVLVGVIAGCGAPSATTPIAPPPPFISTTSAPAPAIISSLILSSSLTPTSTSTEASPTLTSVAAKPIEVSLNTVTVHFPDKVVFSITAKSQSVIKNITLQYGSDERVLAPEVSSSKAVIAEGKEVSASCIWLMKKSGSLPPGATLTWSWEIKDGKENTLTTEQKNIVYTDTRFTWQYKEYPGYNVYWHDQDDSLVNTLVTGLESRLARIEINVQIPDTRKPKVFIYRSSDELRDAILFQNEWAGAMAFPSYNIILTAVNNTNMDWAIDALPHEITHLLVAEAVFGPFGKIPTWLNEGLAEYSSPSVPAYLSHALDKAIKNNTLMPISTLSGSFPVSTEEAYLAYAESGSIVNFFIEKYGWEKMRLLLGTYKDGSTDDQAMQKAFSLDMKSLETLWKTSIGAR